MEFKAEGRPITALDVQLDIDRFRASQRYIKELPEGSEEREALEATINLAFDFICEIINEHGIETYEDMIAFELGYITKWRD